MTPEILIYLIGLFISLFSIGTLLCLALYKWDYHRYFTSTLWVKTYYWIPIFSIFLIMLYLQFWAAALIVVIVALLGLRELFKFAKKDWAAWMYMLVIILALCHLLWFFIQPDTDKFIRALVVIGFSSVLSDVFAYFFGNFLGKHKLPNWINPRKSWEGVIGQVVGAVVGFLIIAPKLDLESYLGLAFVIGIASAIGDILNSLIKRRVNIKDWGNTIPGHGGVLDRFASLAFAIAAGYWWLVLI